MKIGSSGVTKYFAVSREKALVKAVCSEFNSSRVVASNIEIQGPFSGHND